LERGKEMKIRINKAAIPKESRDQKINLTRKRAKPTKVKMKDHLESHQSTMIRMRRRMMKRRRSKAADRGRLRGMQARNLPMISTSILMK
jgi:hypothetical protein